MRDGESKRQYQNCEIDRKRANRSKKKTDREAQKVQNQKYEFDETRGAMKNGRTEGFQKRKRRNWS